MFDKVEKAVAWIMLERLLSIADNDGTADVLTVISSSLKNDEAIGKMLIVAETGQVQGECEEDLTRQIVAEVKNLNWLKPVVIALKAQNGETYRVYWDRIRKEHKAVIFGGGHISQTLVQMLGLLHFKVTVIDDRPEFANWARFPLAQEVICQNFAKVFAQLNIDKDTAIIIVTRGHRYDLDCLRATVDCTARYWGMIGSRRRIKEIMKLLKAEGVTEERLLQLRAPIGLNIHAETPEEIAVSIAAEVVAVFRGGADTTQAVMGGES